MRRTTKPEEHAAAARAADDRAAPPSREPTPASSLDAEPEGTGRGNPQPGETTEPKEAQAAGVAETSAEPAVDYRDKWLRAEADLQNFRRRAQRDTEEAVRFAEDQSLLEIISNLDDLERALEVAREAGAPDPWAQGVRLVASRMSEYLARQGVTVIDSLGEPFNPELHEALLEVDAPEDRSPGHVVQVVRKGYRRGGRALRPARVVVARRPGMGET
jgi:molecular chaperone GrpE